MTEDQNEVEILKEDFLKKRLEAEKAAYKYFQACDIGREREFAHEVYERIRTATLKQ